MDIDEILARVKEAAGIKRDKEIAPLLGLSASSFSNRKQRGTLLPLIAEWAAREEINATWILKGEGEMRPGQATEKADLKTMRDVIEAVEEHLQAEGKQLPPAKKADLITMLYEMFSEEENKQIDKKTVAKLIKLAS